MAPELCTEAGLTLDEAVGRCSTASAAARRHRPDDLPDPPAMRTAARSPEIAELAVRWRDEGVVGFDIAGAEEGYPPTRHLDAFEYVRRENFHTTIHAGEAFGLPSIWEAVQFCGAERLGHGVRIVDDIAAAPGNEGLGRLAAFVRDRRIPLELCPTSNIGTGRVQDGRRAPDRHAAPAAVPRHGQHRQPADERDIDDVRDASSSPKRSAGASTTSNG